MGNLRAELVEEDADEEEAAGGEQEDIFELEGVTEAQMMAQHLRHAGVAAADAAAQPHRSGWEGVAAVESADDVSLVVPLHTLELGENGKS